MIKEVPPVPPPVGTAAVTRLSEMDMENRDFITTPNPVRARRNGKKLPLGEDATELIRLCGQYLEFEVTWDAEMMLHLAHFKGLLETEVDEECIALSDVDEWIKQRHNLVIEQIQAHIIREVGQDQYPIHGTKGSYNLGCRGLLCRRANRQSIRTQSKSAAQNRFALADAMLDEADQMAQNEVIRSDVVLYEDMRRAQQ